MAQTARPLAVVTGASSGIGYELAHLCAKNGYDLVIAADRPEIHDAATHFRHHGVHVESVQADLSTMNGVDKLYAATHGMPVDALLANAGHGLGHAFLDQDFAAARHVVDTNITGTIYLIHKIGNDMRQRGSGRILLTGSVAGFIPGSFQAVYNGTKAFIDSFSFALRDELRGTGVTVTCLMPGPTDTDFFERAGMSDTSVGQGAKDDPAFVAQVGFDAMMQGEGDVVAGWKNKIQTSVATVTPSGMLARQHRKMAEPLHEQHRQNQRRHDHNHERQDEGHSALWSVMLPAGLAVAAGVALMSTSRSRGESHVEHVDWRAQRNRRWDRDFDGGFARDQQSFDQRSSWRDQDVASTRSFDHRTTWRDEDGRTHATTGATPTSVGANAGATGDMSRRDTAATRMPYQPSNTGRDTVGETGAFRNANINPPTDHARITE